MRHDGAVPAFRSLWVEQHEPKKGQLKGLMGRNGEASLIFTRAPPLTKERNWHKPPKRLAGGSTPATTENLAAGESCSSETAESSMLVERGRAVIIFQVGLWCPPNIHGLSREFQVNVRDSSRRRS